MTKYDKPEISLNFQNEKKTIPWSRICDMAFILFSLLKNHIKNIYFVFREYLWCISSLLIDTFPFQGNQEQWHIVFYIVAAIYFGGGVFYLVFGSGELQDWAKDEKVVVDSSPNTSFSNIEKAWPRNDVQISLPHILMQNTTNFRLTQFLVNGVVNLTMHLFYLRQR